MRFVWAVAAFVLAAVMIASGVAQRTLFQGPKIETTAIESAGSASYTLIDGAVLNRLPGAQTLRAAADGTVFAAYGRTADLKAWLSDTEYNAVTLDKDSQVQTELVGPADAAEGDDPQHRDPAGADLWLDEFQQDDILIEPLQLPDTMSVLVATNGTDPAPADLSVTWPVHRSTPWAGPLIVGGSILMLVGVFLYILGIRRMRRSRGPRRKALPPLPDAQTEDQTADLSVEQADKGVISAGEPAKAPARRRRRAFVAIPVVLVGTLAFSGCTADAWPQFGGSPTPTPTETVVDTGDTQPPAVTTSQADRILARISKTVAQADEKKDAKLAATRLAGAPLAERKTNYTLRKEISKEAALSALPASGLKVVLPQAYEGWPRTVLMVADEKKDDDTVESTLMMISQADPWSPYKLTYTGRLEASSLPDVAPAYLGATAVQPDSSFLVMPPADIAAAYADVIDKGDKSASAAQFDTDEDPFLKGVATKRKEQLAEFNKTAKKKTGSLKFAAAAGSEPPLALATLESGAIVAVSVHETETAKPTNDDAVIKLDNNPRAEALTGVKESQTGFTTTYSDQLFFYVPGVGSTDAQIRLLGYSSNILGVKVVSK
ncbi:glycosyl transferase [Microbacterium protaetiae]|uniref:glycosyl transferase n=1 Tax=Microbacterium protaetiae TaxID=2509458 RepID=UPI001A914F59|nr:glycosyl transferase [Microbacterium protaetiae]